MTSKMTSQMKKQLIASRKALKQKYQSLKSDMIRSSTLLEKNYMPLTQPIKQLISTLQNAENVEPKKEIIEQKVEFKTPSKSEPKIIAEPQFLDDGEVFESVPEAVDLMPEEMDQFDQYMEESTRNFLDLTRHPSFEEYLEAFETPLPRIYVEENIKDTEGLFDHRFGIYHDIQTEKFTIGDSEVDFHGPNLIIKGVEYIGTPGLYELLFKNNPIGYQKTDVEQYIDILKRTNALYRENDPTKPLKSATRDVKDKFTFIIAPHFKPRQRANTLPARTTRGTIRKATGKGLKLHLLDLNNKRKEYQYFDNYNELVERLKLLVASQVAGNTSHNNEILSILEELREGKIIK